MTTIRLRINTTKTKYLLAGDSDHLGSSVLVDGDHLELVKVFCYLGTVVTSDCDISSEIRRRIVQGNRAHYGLPPTADIQKTLRPHEMSDTSYVDALCGPLSTCALDHSIGGFKRSGRV